MPDDDCSTPVGSSTSGTAKLNKLNPGPFVEVHPQEAAELGLAEGDSVEVASRRGRAVLPAVVIDRVRPGCCFAPFHWKNLFGEYLSVNAVTNDAVDPLSFQPEFKDVRGLADQGPPGCRWRLRRWWSHGHGSRASVAGTTSATARVLLSARRPSGVCHPSSLPVPAPLRLEPTPPPIPTETNAGIWPAFLTASRPALRASRCCRRTPRSVPSTPCG